MEVILSILVARFGSGPEPTEEYIRLTRLEGIVVSVLCAVLLVVLLFAPQ